MNTNVAAAPDVTVILPNMPTAGPWPGFAEPLPPGQTPTPAPPALIFEEMVAREPLPDADPTWMVAWPTTKAVPNDLD